MAVCLTSQRFPFGNELSNEYRGQLFEKLFAPERPQRVGGQDGKRRADCVGTVRG